MLISLVILQIGYNLISRALKIPIYTDTVCSKGISDYYKSPEKEEKINIMKDIEKKINAKKFSFGYKSSEALITMIRTPNNTFPIFWKKFQIKDNDEYIPPFFRN